MADITLFFRGFVTPGVVGECTDGDRYADQGYRVVADLFADRAESLSRLPGGLFALEVPRRSIVSPRLCTRQPWYKRGLYHQAE